MDKDLAVLVRRMVGGQVMGSKPTYLGPSDRSKSTYFILSGAVDNPSSLPRLAFPLHIIDTTSIQYPEGEGLG